MDGSKWSEKLMDEIVESHLPDLSHYVPPTTAADVVNKVRSAMRMAYVEGVRHGYVGRSYLENKLSDA